MIYSIFSWGSLGRTVLGYVSPRFTRAPAYNSAYDLGVLGASRQNCENCTCQPSAYEKKFVNLGGGRGVSLDIPPYFPPLVWPPPREPPKTQKHKQNYKRGLGLPSGNYNYIRSSPNDPQLKVDYITHSSVIYKHIHLVFYTIRNDREKEN